MRKEATYMPTPHTPINRMLLFCLVGVLVHPVVLDSLAKDWRCLLGDTGQTTLLEEATETSQMPSRT